MRKDWTYTSARAGYRRIFMMTEGPAWETLFGDGRQWHWDTRRGKSTPAGERPSAAGPLLPVALAAGQRIGSRPPYLYRFWSRCAFRVVRCVRRADALLESSFAHRRSASRGESAAPDGRAPMGHQANAEVHRRIDAGGVAVAANLSTSERT